MDRERTDKNLSSGLNQGPWSCEAATILVAPPCVSALMCYSVLFQTSTYIHSPKTENVEVPVLKPLKNLCRSL